MFMYNTCTCIFFQSFSGSHHYSGFLPNEPVFLTGLICTGSESNLMDCPTAAPLGSVEECTAGPANVICDGKREREREGEKDTIKN